MTDETNILAGRIARVLDEVRDDLCGFDAEEMSAAVLPIVAAEVRKAKAEALREAADEDSETLYSVAGWEMQAVEADELRRRATTIEQED